MLIREVAYAGLAKASRAAYHQRFAAWLGEKAGEELLEIRAYHLDQAVALLTELDGQAPAELTSRTPRQRSRARASARLRRRPTAPPAASCRGRRSWSRRSSAATRRRRPPGGWATSRPCGWRCAPSEAAAREVGDTRLEARANTALAEVVLYRDGDVDAGRALAERALELIDGQDDEARYDALEVLSLVGWWTGNISDVERYSGEMLALAESSGRKDLASLALTTLASAALSRLEDERAEELIPRAVELAEASGSLYARHEAFRSQADLADRRGDLDAAAAAYEQARELAAEAGATAALAGVLRHLASILEKQGETARAEKLLRESIRMLRQMDRRGTLVESLRALAELLLREGKIEEAERYALEAREVLTPHDVTSRVTTAIALALVREAQGRDAEAEELLPRGDRRSRPRPSGGACSASRCATTSASSRSAAATRRRARTRCGSRSSTWPQTAQPRRNAPPRPLSG